MPPESSAADRTSSPRLPPVGVRYRCSACGNLTRFDVRTTRTTQAFHHYSVGGELEVEDVDVLAEHIEEVSCRWCGSASAVVELGAVSSNGVVGDAHDGADNDGSGDPAR